MQIGWKVRLEQKGEVDPIHCVSFIQRQRHLGTSEWNYEDCEYFVGYGLWFLTWTKLLESFLGLKSWECVLSAP